MTAPNNYSAKTLRRIASLDRRIARLELPFKYGPSPEMIADRAEMLASLRAQRARYKQPTA